MTLRNWTRFKEYEGGEKPLTQYDANPPERVFFNTETGYYISVVKDTDGTYDVKVGWQDSGWKAPFDDDSETAPLPPDIMDAYNNWDTKDEAISEAYEMRKNRKAKIPREDRYGHEDRATLYEIADEHMIDKEFFATFWEIRFPRNTDRHYAGEWAERLMYSEDQVQAVADPDSMDAYRKAQREVNRVENEKEGGQYDNDDMAIMQDIEEVVGQNQGISLEELASELGEDKQLVLNYLNEPYLQERVEEKMPNKFYQRT